MKLARLMLCIQWMMLCVALGGCCRNNDNIWDDTKTCGRHMNRGIRTLGGKNGDSRAVCNPDEFYCVDEVSSQPPVAEDFVPLTDDARGSDIGMKELSTPQPRETPGDPGSSIPGIEAFHDPSTDAQLAAIFKNVHFEYNQHLIKGEDNLVILRKVADYMRSNPNTYVFVEGHCDERGPEAYNLALGARRANAIRDMLVNNGVHPDHVFTISYGKERPLVLDHHEEAWAQNRRGEFKIYVR